MPGDYLFPKRLFKSGEPLDTVELNDALQVAAERLNGHLGPHNIRAPLDPALSAAAGTFFRTKVATVDVDPLMETAVGSATGTSPRPEAAGVFLLEQETGWMPVTGSEDMVVEVSTGASSLAITAQAAHCYAGDYDGANARFSTKLSSISVALFDRIANFSCTIILGSVSETVVFSVSTDFNRKTNDEFTRDVASTLASKSRSVLSSQGFIVYANG